MILTVKILFFCDLGGAQLANSGEHAHGTKKWYQAVTFPAHPPLTDGITMVTTISTSH